MKNISLFGQDFVNVPAVNVPKTGGGTAQFDDTTDANAIASDIAVGKTAYVDGSKITGTATPPTGTKQISITSNGTYTEDVASYASAEIEVDVANSYSASDEGKVVDNGSLVSQTSATYTENDTYDTTTVNSVTVNVSGGGISVDDLATNTAPSGTVTLGNSVTTIADYAFAGKPITSIIAPAVKQINQNSLQGTQITTITDVNFPSLGVSEDVAIKFLMSSLVSIKLSGEKITLSSGTGAFRDNTNLVTVELPNCSKSSNNKIMGNACFYGDTNLEFVDIGFCQSIGANAFYNCSKLRTLVMRRTDDVVTLGSWNAATMKGIYDNPASSTIYVPNALISTYQTATNWVSAYNAGVAFVKIEGSIYA